MLFSLTSRFLSSLSSLLSLKSVNMSSEMIGKKKFYFISGGFGTQKRTRRMWVSQQGRKCSCLRGRGRDGGRQSVQGPSGGRGTWGAALFPAVGPVQPGPAPALTGPQPFSLGANSLAPCPNTQDFGNVPQVPTAQPLGGAAPH